ncbi:MAG: lipid II flippase MurJ [Dehalococcoidia bacterium]
MAMRSETRQALPVRLGGVAATAEAAWMATPQAAEFLELPRQARRWPLARARLPRVAIPAIVNREFGIAGITAILMASFFASALLGAVRQIVFNARFGAGAEASAYYAAFRLPDTLFSLLAGSALSSAFIPVLVGVRQQDGDEAARRLAGLVLTTLLALVLLVALVGELAAAAVRAVSARAGLRRRHPGSNGAPDAHHAAPADHPGHGQRRHRGPQ